MAAVAFFDLDKTLWPCVGEKAFAYHQLACGGITLRQFLKIISLQIRYDLHLIDGTETLKRKILEELFGGEMAAPCLQVYSRLFQQELRRAFFPEMLDLIEQHRQAGDRIVIVSATIDFIAQPAADFVQADDCFSTVLEIRDERFSGAVLGPIPFGQAKARIVEDYARRHGIDLGQCHAYGDHWEDRHMLGVVGHPVVVNPDPKLLRHAELNGWHVRALGKARFANFRYARKLTPIPLEENP